MCLKVFSLTCTDLGPCNRTVVLGFFAFKVILEVLAFSSSTKRWPIKHLTLYIYFKYFGNPLHILKLWVCILVYAGLYIPVEHVAVCISVTCWVHCKPLFSVSYVHGNKNFSHIVSIWRLLLFSVRWVLGNIQLVQEQNWQSEKRRKERKGGNLNVKAVLSLFLNNSVPQGFDRGTWNLARL